MWLPVTLTKPRYPCPPEPRRSCTTVEADAGSTYNQQLGKGTVFARGR